MTGARAAVDDGTPTEARHRIGASATTIGPWLPPGELGETLADGLARVEAVLATSVDSEHSFVREAAGHLMAAGGKRFRPMLALLAAQLGGGAVPEVVRAAVVCELTHLATLYHDDVMDEAAVRRGAPSANSRWGNSVAILVGDLLFARASDLLADLGPEAVRIQAQTFERLVIGQIRETVGAAARRGPGRALPRGARRQDRLAGGHLGAVRRPASPASPDALVDALTAFGEEVGVAFQLSDDLLDIVSQDGASGKSPGTDLREGIATLPVLLALAGDDPAEARLRELVAGPVTDDGEHAEALALLRSSASLRRATEVLREYADRARAAAGRRPRRRGARRPLGAVRLRGHPHQLTVRSRCGTAGARRRRGRSEHSAAGSASGRPRARAVRRHGSGRRGPTDHAWPGCARSRAAMIERLGLAADRSAPGRRRVERASRASAIGPASRPRGTVVLADLAPESARLVALAGGTPDGASVTACCWRPRLQRRRAAHRGRGARPAVSVRVRATSASRDPAAATAEFALRAQAGPGRCCSYGLWIAPAESPGR